ncbi:P1 family peptidase [Roseomonas marmotae]|uniref:P1 family peptidase n=1 Tax=Roseomonas marmotae TaxID=2768161 RepID=A0ABS3KL70_9PROT|nr:P1 family peptidase [Roseomonas marmotae]MBO1077076.1 P1 family peptidase [Roseomonas marmotae]QTI81873.1 P1 family peptidase [Roseomonas marmotae]
MSETLNLLTDIPGLRVGHATDLSLGSGVTAVIFDQPAVASVQIGGGAPGTRDTDLLRTEMTVERVDAIVLSGGSTFGLDAAGGVQAALREDGRGIAFAGINIPLAPQAILFDLLNGGDKDWGRFSPYRDLGYQAARAAAAGGFALGSVGAGTGATTATVKGGLGSASTVTPLGHRVAAIVAVNAVGSPLVGDGPWFWAAPFEEGAEFGGQGLPPRFLPEHRSPRLKGSPGTATTIGLVVTDAALTKPQARRLALMADDGLARAILPAHAPNDGDTVFAAATGQHPLEHPVHALTLLGHAATQVMARAVARAVFEATALPWPGAQPAWRDRFGQAPRGGAAA